MLHHVEPKMYFGHIDLSIQEDSHTQSFFFIKDHCDEYKIDNPRILEIGCSSGYFSKVLRAHGMFVYGVEPCTNEALVNDRVDEFFLGSVEQFFEVGDRNLYGTFDAIVLGDVIEHLIDPKNTLLSLAKYLNANGVFVLSVPNITHIGIQHMLRDGQWTYHKYGILDSTHVRFFSWRSLREMLVEIGFGIEKKYCVCVPEENVYPLGVVGHLFQKKSKLSRIRDKLLKKSKKHPFIKSLMLKYNIISFNDSNLNGEVFQFIVRASRKALCSEAFIDCFPQSILILSPGPSSSLVDVRLRNPLKFFTATHGGNVKIISSHECTEHDLDNADILIVHREIHSTTLKLIGEAYKRGLSIVYDTDDLLTGLPEYLLSSLSVVDKLYINYVIAIANVVTCPGIPLKEQLNKVTDRVKILPNIIPSTNDKTEPNIKHYSNDCTLIIASSDTVLVDFLVPVIQSICNRLPDIKVVAIGNISNAFSGVSKNVTAYQLCSPEKFSEILSSIDNAIGLIPLDDSLFSSCKSPIKYFHYTSGGVVTIASSVKPYFDLIDNFHDGILVNNTFEAWLNAINSLITNFQMRRDLLRSAQRTWHEKGTESAAIDAWRDVLYGLPRPFSRVLNL